MVRVEDAVPEPGAMLLGENEQLNVLGRPLQERAIGVVEVPDLIAALTVTFADCPDTTVTAVGEAPKDITAGGGTGGGTTGAIVFGQLGV
jgi:hypothetical protein